MKQNMKQNKTKIIKITFFVGLSREASQKRSSKQCSSLAKLYESIHLHEFMIVLFCERLANIKSKSFGRNVELVVIIELVFMDAMGHGQNTKRCHPSSSFLKD